MTAGRRPECLVMRGLQGAELISNGSTSRQLCTEAQTVGEGEPVAASYGSIA